MKKKDKIYFIYCYTFESGNKYIGQTYHGSGRYGCISNYKHSKFLYSKMEKEKFTKMILEDNISSRKEVNLREKYWVDRENTLYPNGYNLKRGGDGHGLCKISRDNIRSRMLKKGVSAYSQMFTEEAVQKRKKSVYKKIYQIDRVSFKIIKIYNSAFEASLELETDVRPYSSKRKNFFTRGYFWILESEYNLLGVNAVNELIESLNKKCEEARDATIKRSEKAIIMYSSSGEFIKEYKSARECEKETRISNQSICHVLKKRRPLAGGYYFEYKKN